VQRAIEVECQALLVAKQGVDGVLSADPKYSVDAKKYKSLHYNDVIQHNLKVMDQSAFILARDYSLPVHVFNFDQSGSMKAICEGEDIGTLISQDSRITKTFHEHEKWRVSSHAISYSCFCLPFVRKLGRIPAKLLKSLLKLLLLGSFELVPAFLEHRIIQITGTLVCFVQDLNEIRMELLMACFPNGNVKAVSQILACCKSIVNEITVIHLRAFHLRLTRRLRIGNDVVVLLLLLRVGIQQLIAHRVRLLIASSAVSGFWP
jgi:hypothetical protein